MCGGETRDAKGRLPGLVGEEVSSDSASIPESVVHATCRAEGEPGIPWASHAAPFADSAWVPRTAGRVPGVAALPSE